MNAVPELVAANCNELLSSAIVGGVIVRVRLTLTVFGALFARLGVTVTVAVAFVVPPRTLFGLMMPTVNVPSPVPEPFVICTHG
jgi:hypothetical protein